MSENKAIDKANLELALSENNRRILEHIDASDAALRQDLNVVSKYQKYLNTELDYAQVSIPNDTAVDVSLNSIIPFTKVKASNNIDYDASTYTFTLKAGKTYKVLSSIRILNSSGYFYFAIYNKTNNTTLGVAGCVETPATYNVNVADTTAYAIIKCDVDTEVQVKVTSIDKARTITFTGLSTAIVEEINRQIVIDPVEHVNTEYGLEDSPVGHIISHMGTKAPKHYLICDGSEYNILDYPLLANHILDNFGSYNYFGGDGELTFAVPSKISVEDSWTANSNYIFEKTGIFSVVGGRDFYKQNEGKAIVAVSRTSEGYTFPWVISTNPEYVINYCSYDTSVITYPNGTVEYLGLTWHYARAWFGFLSSASCSGFAPMVSCSVKADDYANVVLQILKAASVKNVPIEVIPCIKYEPTYYMAIQNPLVGRGETVLFKGNYSESNNSNTLTLGTTLNDSIENYDELYFEIHSDNILFTRCVKVESFVYGYPLFEISEHATKDFFASITLGFIDAHTLSIGWLGSAGWASPYISKVIGIKYQEIQGNDDTSGGEISCNCETYTDEEVDLAIDNILYDKNLEENDEQGLE